MNLLEHYIKEIHSVEDVTERFKENVGYYPKERYFEVDMTYACYGVTERSKRMMFQTEWEQAKESGYFMA